MSDKENIQKFIGALNRLEPGERAKLKRNAGQTLNDSRDVMGLFYNKLLRNIELKPWEEEIYFLVATLYPFDKRRGQVEAQDDAEEDSEMKITEQKRTPSLGRSLYSVRSEKNSSGLDRRVERLLDSDDGQLVFYLRRDVHFVTNEGGRIDWAQLLDDLLHWKHPERYIQRRWAQDYFTYRPAVETTS